MALQETMHTLLISWKVALLSIVFLVSTLLVWVDFRELSTNFYTAAHLGIRTLQTSSTVSSPMTKAGVLLNAPIGTLAPPISSSSSSLLAENMPAPRSDLLQVSAMGIPVCIVTVICSLGAAILWHRRIRRSQFKWPLLATVGTRGRPAWWNTIDPADVQRADPDDPLPPPDPYARRLEGDYFEDDEEERYSRIPPWKRPEATPQPIPQMSTSPSNLGPMPESSQEWSRPQPQYSGAIWGNAWQGQWGNQWEGQWASQSQDNWGGSAAGSWDGSWDNGQWAGSAAGSWGDGSSQEWSPESAALLGRGQGRAYQVMEWALGDRTEVRRALEKVPDLLETDPQVAAHCFDALEKILGQEEARTAAQLNPLLLCYPGVRRRLLLLADVVGLSEVVSVVTADPVLAQVETESLEQQLGRLKDFLGPEGAKAALITMPALVLAEAEQLQQACQALQHTIGDREVAAHIAAQNPALLVGPLEAIPSVYQSLVAILGVEGAKHVLAHDADILNVSAEQLLASLTAVTAVLGVERAAKAAAANPYLKTSPIVEIQERLPPLLDFLGEEGAMQVLKISLNKWPTMARKVIAIADIFGKENVVPMLERQPSLVLTSASGIRDSVDSMKALLPKQEAMDFINEHLEALSDETAPSLQELNRIYGQRDRVIAAIRQCPALLAQGQKRMRHAMAAVQSCFGWHKAQRAFQTCPELLAQPADALARMDTTRAIFLQALGRRIGTGVLLYNPKLLLVSGNNIIPICRSLIARLGEGGLRLVLKRNINVFDVDPLDVEQIVAAMQEALGDTHLVSYALYHNPEIWSKKPLDVKNSIMALLELVGRQATVAALSLKTTALDAKWVDIRKTFTALEEMMGAEMAVKVAQGDPSLLAVPAAQVHAAWDAIREVVGETPALEALRHSTHALKAPADTLKSTLVALANVFGANDVLRVLRMNPGLLSEEPIRVEEVLQATVDTIGYEWTVLSVRAPLTYLANQIGDIQRVIVILTDLLGPAGAADIARWEYMLLQTSPSALADTLVVLKEYLGQDAALRILNQSPGVLLTPALALREVLAALTSNLGQAGTIAVMSNDASFLRPTPPDITQTMAVLTGRFGQQLCTQLIIQDPQLVRITPVLMPEVIQTLEVIFGQEGLSSAVLAEPSILRTMPSRITAAMGNLANILGPDGALQMVQQEPKLLKLEPYFLRKRFANQISQRNAARVATRQADEVTRWRSMGKGKGMTLGKGKGLPVTLGDDEPASEVEDITDDEDDEGSRSWQGYQRK